MGSELAKRVLMVEGLNDQHVMWNLFEVHKIPKVFEVKRPSEVSDAAKGDGKEQLLDTIPRVLLTSELERLALVVDADTEGPNSSWDAVRTHLLKRYGLQDVPKKMPSTGVFTVSFTETDRSLRIGVWMMPDNKRAGMLEDFVFELIDDRDPMLQRVDTFLDSIPQTKRRFKEVHHTKARVHTFLAVSEQPGRPMGQAIKADKHLDANHPTVQPFLNWVQRALVND